MLRRTLAPLGAGILATALISGGALALSPGRGGRESSAAAFNYDIRINGKGDMGRMLAAYPAGTIQGMAREGRARLDTMARERARLAAALPGLEASPRLPVGSAEVVRRARGLLTGAARGGSAAAVALGFIRSHAGLYGLSASQADALQVAGESARRSGSLGMVRLRQMAAGIPIFQGEVRATADAQGRLVRTVGRLVPGVDERLLPAFDGLSASAALAFGLRSIGYETSGAGFTARELDPAGRALEVMVPHPQIPRPAVCGKVWFPAAPGVLIPAWSQVIFTKGAADYYLLVDARGGVPLYRKNIRHTLSSQAARFGVYAQAGGAPADSPSPASPSGALPGSGAQFPGIARTIQSMLASQDPVASPNGWIPDGGVTTTGNNVDAYVDRDGDDLPDAGALDMNGRPMGNPDPNGLNRDFFGGAPRSFDFTPPPAAGDPDDGDDPSVTSYQRGAVTNLFYIANWFHDRLHALGFDEPAGNFQTDNLGRGGAGGDAVLAEAQQGADVFSSNNANFSVGPDGISGIMRMYVWDSPVPARDGDLDAEIVLHELAHGVSSRLIGDAAGLNWIPGGGMGEGWSDFFALSLLNEQPADDPDGRYAAAGYAVYYLGASTDNYTYGIRRFPYSTDNTVNPLTWADVDDTSHDMAGGIAPNPIGFEYNGAFEVHNVGEVWALSLWEVRSRIIAQAGGDVAAGSRTTLRIVTDALKLTPVDPSFTEARDALIDADCAASACAHEEAIWAGFADRGLGYKAEASLGAAAHIGVRESYDTPYLDAGNISVNDAAGDNNGFIDAGETILLTVELVNPWREASHGVPSASAVLASPTPEALINDATAAYGVLPAGGSATGDTFSFTVDPSARCGQSLVFDLATSSALGPATARFTLRVGRPIGPAAPVTLTRTIGGGMAIPEADPRGVFDTFDVAADFEILDLDLRLDSLTHTAVGDLTVELKAPGGLGADVVFRPADCDPFFGCFLGFNAGDNFTNTRFDDGSVNDLMIAGADAAPFTSDWMAAFNSTEWAGFDPVGQLSSYAGAGTRGAWKLFVADHEIFDTGRVNSWSLLVTPMAFACCESATDSDADQIGATCDNCPTVYNPAQQDLDGDDAGDPCDCAPANAGAYAVPSEVEGLDVAADALTLSWTSAAPGAGTFTTHDLLRGVLDQLPVGGTSESCLASGTPGTSLPDGASPAAGQGFWYLVRGRNVCGHGTYGAASDGSTRTSLTCP